MNLHALLRDRWTEQQVALRTPHIEALPAVKDLDGAPIEMEAIFAQYGTYVERVLGRVMGAESNLPDIAQDVYIAILSNIHTVRDRNQLKSWITSLTIFTARQRIRRRVRHRAVWADKNDGLDEIPGKPFDPDAREALALTLRIMEAMPEAERIAFTLRYVEGLEHGEAAKVCGVSLATIKRRVARARCYFNAAIHQHPLLHKWIQEGNRWQAPRRPATEPSSLQQAPQNR